MQYRTNLSDEEKKAFKAKGTWYIVKSQITGHSDEDGDPIDNPDDTPEWEIEEIDDESDIKWSSDYLDEDSDWDCDLHWTTEYLGLYDNEEEAREALKKDVLLWLKGELKSAESRVSKLKKEIEKIKNDAYCDSYSVPSSLNY